MEGRTAEGHRCGVRSGVRAPLPLLPKAQMQRSEKAAFLITLHYDMIFSSVTAEEHVC